MKTGSAITWKERDFLVMALFFCLIKEVNRATIMAISTQEVLPDRNLEIDPSFFNGHESARFWIGRVATGNVVTQLELYNPLLKFRGDVYVNELNYLRADSLDAYGREMDEDDKRSVLFAAVENSTLPVNGNSFSSDPRIVGSARLIVKESYDDPLPVERYFPEAFKLNVAEPGKSAEVSRYIARHSDKMKQHAIALALVRAMTHHCVEDGFEDAYAVVEKPLEQMLNFVGIETERLGEPKFIEELNGELHPLLIKPREVLKFAAQDSEETALIRGFFQHENGDSGEGFYPETLMRVGGRR